MDSPETMSNSPPPSRVYGATRRFDLVTMFVILLEFAILFGLLRATERSIDGFEIPLAVYVGLPLFLTLVGVAQAILYQGQQPRLASALAGVVLLGAIQGTTAVFYSRGAQLFEIPIGMIITVPVHAVYGYLAGAIVAGVFYIADKLRIRLRKHCDRPPES